MSLLPSLIAQLLLAQVAATAPASGQPIIFSSSPAESGEKLEIVRSAVRPATKPAATTEPASGHRVILPDFIETYEARVVGSGRTERILCRYERGWFSEFSSNRMRYRVLSARVIDDYLFLVEKMTLCTSVLRIHIGATPEAAKPSGSKFLIIDREVDGPIIVSAAIREAGTWERSTVVLNHDQAAEHRREFVLGECFRQD